MGTVEPLGASVAGDELTRGATRGIPSPLRSSMSHPPAATTPTLWVAVYQPEQAADAASRPEEWGFGLGASRDAAVTALVHACRHARWRWVAVGQVHAGEGFSGVPRNAERVLARG